MTPIIAEIQSGVPPTDPIYTDMGLVEMPNVHCEGWGAIPTSAECVGPMREAWSRRKPGHPKCVKLSWLGTRTFAAVSGDRFLKPNADRIIPRLAGRILDFETPSADGNSDLSMLMPVGADCSVRNDYPDIIFIDEESALGPWANLDVPHGPDAASPERIKGIQESNDNNRAIMVFALSDPACRAQMAQSLQSIKPDVTPGGAIDVAMWQFGPESHLFEDRQRDFALWWGTIKQTTIIVLLQHARLIGPNTIIYIANQGRWPGFACDNNGHQLPSIKPVGPIGANMQMYGPGGIVTVRAAGMCHTSIARLTYLATDSAFDIDKRLTYATPLGAFLWFPTGPRDADHLADVLRKHTVSVLSMK